MKRNNPHLNAPVAAASIALAMWLSAPALGGEKEGSYQREFYFSLDAGVNLMQDFNVAASAPGLSATGVEKADVGWRMGFTGGYNLNRFLAVEAEIGYAYTPLHDIDASFDYVPLLVNVVFRYENQSRFTPYVGVGGGGAASIFNFDENTIRDEDSEIVFAWQAKAGVCYKINDKLSIGIGYKYFGTAEQSYRIEIDTAGNDLKFKTSNLHTHFVGLVLQGSF